MGKQSQHLLCCQVGYHVFNMHAKSLPDSIAPPSDSTVMQGLSLLRVFSVFPHTGWFCGMQRCIDKLSCTKL